MSFYSSVSVRSSSTSVGNTGIGNAEVAGRISITTVTDDSLKFTSRWQLRSKRLAIGILVHDRMTPVQ